MRRKYTLDQLRSMLVGKKWSDFKKPTNSLKGIRVLHVNNVFFTLKAVKFLMRPAYRIRANDQTVVLQYTDDTFASLALAIRYNDKWWPNAVENLGCIINRVEDVGRTDYPQ